MFFHFVSWFGGCVQERAGHVWFERSLSSSFLQLSVIQYKGPTWNDNGGNESMIGAL
eukprot:m.27211 g.27211  ORF g.27211 m.27211 type:complete len:57 (-) comp5918_c0_seq1:3874-4044(-)